MNSYFFQLSLFRLSCSCQAMMVCNEKQKSNPKWEGVNYKYLHTEGLLGIRCIDIRVALFCYEYGQ